MLIVNESVLDEYAKLDLPGEPSLAVQVIEQFIYLSPGRLQLVRDALHEKNPERLRRASHSLKNLAASAGAERLSHFAREMEEMGRTGQLPSVWKLLAALESENQAATNALLLIICPKYPKNGLLE